MKMPVTHRRKRDESSDSDFDSSGQDLDNSVFLPEEKKITPKVDMSMLANTAKRVARAGEVFFSVNGSPVMPNINPRTKVRI